MEDGRRSTVIDVAILDITLRSLRTVTVSLRVVKVPYGPLPTNAAKSSKTWASG